MSEMVQRVARAMEPEIWAAEAMERSEKAGLAREHAEMLGHSLRRARAAIAAMREPSDAMIDAGVCARQKLYEGMEAEGVDTRTMLVAKHPAGTIYAAMIDAALSHG